MSDNSRKTPLAASLPASMRQEFEDLDQLAGKVWPCHVVSVQGQIVTVAFDLVTSFTLPQITMPIFGPEYIRFPTQVGDKGICLAADAFLGPTAGLGGSTANLTKPSNLGALVFMPIGSKNFSTVDGNVLVMYGPNGVTIRDKASNTVINLTAASVTMTRGSSSFALDNTGVTIHGDLTVTGNTSFGGGAKKVVLDGDPVSGGAVHATSTTIVAT